MHLQIATFDPFLICDASLVSDVYTRYQFQVLTTPRTKPLKNIVEKGENAGNQHFLLFPQCFLYIQTQTSLDEQLKL